MTGRALPGAGRALAALATGEGTPTAGAALEIARRAQLGKAVMELTGARDFDAALAAVRAAFPRASDLRRAAGARAATPAARPPSTMARPAGPSTLTRRALAAGVSEEAYAASLAHVTAAALAAE
jgi:hypothetical protein